MPSSGFAVRNLAIARAAFCSLLTLLLSLSATAAPGELIIQKENAGSPKFSELRLTPIAGRVLGWNGTALTNVDLSIYATNSTLGSYLTTATAATTYQPIILTGSIALDKLATNPLARANHTGTQPHTTITGLGTLATQNGTFSDKANLAGGNTFTGAQTFGTTKPFYLLPDWAGFGELGAGTLLGSYGAGSGSFSFFPSINGGDTGAKVAMGYASGGGTNVYSAAEVANVASGYSNLLLMKSGGNVLVGTATDSSNGKLQVAGGISSTTGFTGPGTGLTGTASGLTAGNATLAASATILANARTINGVSFNGSANIGQDLQTTASPTFVGATLSGNLSLGSSSAILWGTNSCLKISGDENYVFSRGNGGSQRVRISVSDVITASGGIYGFNSASTLGSGAVDSAISRISAGLFGFGTGASGSFAGSWKATNGELVGTLSVTSTSTLGTATVGAWPTVATFARFTNASIAGTADAYALMQGTGGDTYLNAATNNAISFRINNSEYAKLASSGSFQVSGQSLTGSQATNTLELSPTWNTTGNPSLIYSRVTNTASGSTANLIDLGTVAGGSLFAVSKTGDITAPSGFQIKGGGSQSSRIKLWDSFGASKGIDFLTYNASAPWWKMYMLASGETMLSMVSSGSLAWSSVHDAGATADLVVRKDAANVLAQRNDANAQASRIYGTYTSATSYERLAFEAGKTGGTGEHVIDSQKGSGGGSLQPIKLKMGGTTVLEIGTTAGTVKITGLPIVDPGIPGQLYNDGGFLKISP